MARVKDVALSVRGEQQDAVFSVDVELDWDRRDRDRQYQLLLRFKGADTGLRGDDDVLLVHSVAVTPDEGDHRRIDIANTDRRFNEDRGGKDEVYVEVELHELPPEDRIVRSNKVKGRF